MFRRPRRQINKAHTKNHQNRSATKNPPPRPI
jgi:hypothetical protein